MVIKNLLIINGLFFFAQFTFDRMGSTWMYDYLALHDIRSAYFRPHQLVTHLFMHGGLWHIIFNMFALWMFGSALEDVWGPKRFLLFYFLCGLGAAALHLATLYFDNAEIWQYFYSLPLAQQEELRYGRNALNDVTVGASGAVFGCLAAFGYLFPNNLIYIYAIIPIKAKWFVLIYAGAELFMGVQNSAGDNVAHWAHLGGALVGFLLVLYWNKTKRRRFY